MSSSLIDGSHRDGNRVFLGPLLGMEAPDFQLAGTVCEQGEENPRILTSQFSYGDEVYGAERCERVQAIPQLQCLLEARLSYLDSQDGDFAAEKERIQSILQHCEKALSGRSHVSPLVQKEIQDRLDRISVLRQQYEAQLHLANTLGKHGLVNGAQAQALPKIQRQINELESEIDAFYSHNAFDWIGSNYFRDSLEESKEKIEQGTWQEVLENYKGFANGIIPAPANMRRHEIMAGGEKVTILRAGVFSDMTNGYYSLPELLEMQGDDVLRASKHQQLAKLCKNKKTVTRKRVVRAHARDQIASPEALRGAIAQRRFFLRNQMLLLVLEHVKTAHSSGDLQDMTTLPMMHLCLLNRKTDSVDETGWKKSEKVFMEDMAQIFREFDGAELVFDGKGPLLDEEGRIHLPSEYGATEQAITLRTLFANVSPQGHTKNDKIQAELNEEFFARLEDCFKGYDLKEFEEVRARLKKGESNFDLAIDLCEVALKHGLFLSNGCLSAKDRTGMVNGHLAVRFTLESGCKGLTEGQKKECASNWGTEVLSGVALEICKECNLRALNPGNVTALKLISGDLPGVKWGERMRQWGKLAGMFVAPKSVKAERKKASPPKLRHKLAKQVDKVRAHAKIQRGSGTTAGLVHEEGLQVEDVEVVELDEWVQKNVEQCPLVYDQAEKQVFTIQDDGEDLQLEVSAPSMNGKPEPHETTRDEVVIPIEDLRLPEEDRSWFSVCWDALGILREKVVGAVSTTFNWVGMVISYPMNWVRGTWASMWPYDEDSPV